MRAPETHDDDSLKALRVLRWLVIVMIWGAFVFIMFPIAIYTLPDLESAWYPPIKQQKISNEHLMPGNPNYLLFDWSFIKQRRAEAEFITWMAYLPELPQERYAVDAYIGWDCKDNFRTDRGAPPSPNRVVRKVCIRLPDKLAGRPDTLVDGVFDFRVGHGFYTVPVKVLPNQDPETTTDVHNIPVPIASPK